MPDNLANFYSSLIFLFQLPHLLSLNKSSHLYLNKKKILYKMLFNFFGVFQVLRHIVNNFLTCFSMIYPLFKSNPASQSRFPNFHLICLPYLFPNNFINSILLLLHIHLFHDQSSSVSFSALNFRTSSKY